MVSFYERYITTKLQIFCILFFSYIWDLVRTGYFVNKRRHLSHLRELNYGLPYLRLAQHRRLSNTFSEPPGPPDTSKHELSSAKSANAVSVARISHDKIEPEVVQNSSIPTNVGNVVVDHDVDHDDLDDCPLEEMPRFIRLYQYVSHTLIVIVFVKYIVLNILDNELMGLSKLSTCYIPGRLRLLPELSPSFPLIVLFYHAVYRLYLCIICKSFQLDCFLFVLYEQDHVQSIERQYNWIIQQQRRRPINELTKARLASELHKLFAANQMFFICLQRAYGTNGSTTYRLRSNRNFVHWRKLRLFYHRFSLVYAINLIVWGVPLSMLILYPILYDANLDLLYGHCAVLGPEANPAEFNWSHWQRYARLFFDLIDSGWLLFDTAHALVWPFSSLVLCAQDMTNSFATLNESMDAITQRFVEWLGQEANKFETKYRAIKRPNKQLGRWDRSRFGQTTSQKLQEDIDSMQSEINDVMHQLNLVDQYVSKQACWVIFCLIITNLYYQVMCLTKERLVIYNVVIHYIQLTAFSAITFSFAYLSITHTKSKRLYNQICNLMALDPNQETKASWLLVLEFYEKDSSRYSLHLGPYAELTFSNYLKSVSWLITGALMTLSLFIQNYRNKINDTGNTHT